MFKRPKGRFCYTYSMNIGFDLDGVIIDHSITIVGLAEELGYTLSPEETNSVDLKKLISNEYLEKLNEKLYADSSILKSSKFMPSAEDCLGRLSEGNNLYLLSRRSKETGKQIMEIFGLHRFFNPGSVYFVDSSSEKLPLAQKNSITHYIDDQPRILDGIMRPISNKYLFDQFDNLPVSSNYEKVTNLLALSKILVSS
jgi:uncharacterized HAD superfamily protein